MLPSTIYSVIFILTMESANVSMRRELDLYANCRPVCVPEQGNDWIFFRENTEGEYVLSSRGDELPGMDVDFKVTTDAGTRRIVRAAFAYARNNGKTHMSVIWVTMQARQHSQSCCVAAAAYLPC